MRLLLRNSFVINKFTTMKRILQRLGTFAWFDCVLLVWGTVSILSSLFYESSRVMLLLSKIDVVFTVLFGLSGLNAKDPCKTARFSSGNWSKILTAAWTFLIITFLVNLFRFEIQDFCAMDSEFPLRASILFVLGIIVFLSTQFYYLRKKIW